MVATAEIETSGVDAMSRRSRSVERRLTVLLLAVGTLSAAVTGCTAAGSSHSPGSASTGAKQVALAGASFRSTGGSVNGNDVAWLRTDPLRVSFATENGTLTAIIDTPCNTVDMPVDLHDGVLHPDAENMAATAMGCLGEAGAREQWATAFFSQTMRVAQTAHTLVVTTSGAEIDFAR